MAVIMCGAGGSGIVCLHPCTLFHIQFIQEFPLGTLRLSAGNTYFLCPLPALMESPVSTHVGFSSNLLFLKQGRACCSPVRNMYCIPTAVRLKSVLCGWALQGPSHGGPRISRSQLKCQLTSNLQVTDRSVQPTLPASLTVGVKVLDCRPTRVC